MPVPASVRPVVTQAITLGILLVLIFTTTFWLYTLQQSRNNPPDCIGSIARAHYSNRRPIDIDNGNQNYFTKDETDGNIYNGPQSVEPLQSIKEPSTPPDSLPSDPYAQYIYQEELRLRDDYSNGDNFDRPSRKTRRTIVVGDVHGSLEGLDGFLRKIKYDTDLDVLILAGDMVTKGPESLKVIDRAIELKAKCVRGNHDDTVIRWRGFLNSLTVQQQEAVELDEGQGDEGEDQICKGGRGRRNRQKIPSDLNRKSEHYDIARSLNREQYNYLRNCPLILTLPRELSVHSIPIHVVHAGIDPMRDILKQQPWVLINVRNMLEDGTPSRKKGKGRGWAKEFNELHSRRSPTKRDFLVVYGHDASRSLNVMTWSIGLDSGCVYGRELSGYVVETGEILSVPCPKV